MFEDVPMYNEDEFVSIDLNDDHEECDICHQITDEKIVKVILSDEFTLFEGSYDKHCGGLTKAHQLCLKRWADIIARNIQFSTNRTNSPSSFNEHSSARSSPTRTGSPLINEKSYLSNSPTLNKTINNLEEDSIQDNEKDNRQHTEEAVLKDDDLFNKNHQLNCENSAKNNNINNSKGSAIDINTSDLDTQFSTYGCNDGKINTYTKLKQSEITPLEVETIKDIVENLNNLISEFSVTLVDELQLRDRLLQEISAQKSAIEQLVGLQKKNENTTTTMTTSKKKIMSKLNKPLIV